MATVVLIRGQSRLSRAEDRLKADVGGELVMIDPERGLYYGLNPVATDVWHRLATPTLLADLIDALARDYHASTRDVERDVLSFLPVMIEHGLIEVS